MNDCGSCGDACGSPPNTTNVSCAASSCTFTCDANYYNQNGQYADGCECSTIGYTVTSACAAATVQVVSPLVIVNERLLGAPASWWVFTFPSDAGSCGMHYTIDLSTNGNPLAMTVFENCAGTDVSCTGTESTTGYTTWNWTNSGMDCTQAYPTTYYVEVFSTASGTTCMDYTLTAVAQ